MRHPVPLTMTQAAQTHEQTPNLWGTVQALLAELTANAEASTYRRTS
jgi:hypothetical protein